MRTTLLSTALIGLMANATLASDDTTGHGHMDHSQMEHGQMDHSQMGHGQMDHGMMNDDIKTQVTINSIIDGTVNVSHGPIPEIGWPSMTMDLNLLEGAEVGAVEPGDEAIMTLEKGDDGMFAIRALAPIE